MKKYLLIIGFLLTSFVSFSQVIPKPNPTAVGIGYKRLLADSTIFIPTGGAIPRLGSNNINRRSAIYADTINKRLWVFYPNDSTWKVAGLTKITWDSVTNKPTYFLTKYDSSTDIKDSIQARLALRDTANMLSPYIKIVDVHGLPVGGTTGQILAKIDETDYNTQWIDNYTGDIRQYVKAGEAINKGQAVYVSSADGTNIIVSKASNASESTSSKTLGLLYQTLALNGQGFVITEGRLEGLNTLGATAGDPVWLGTNGNLIFGLANKPYAPAHLVYIGVVSRVNANNGEILVKIQNGFELKELHDVSAQSPSNNDGLFYNSSNSLWETKSIATALGYTPANAATYVPYTGATTGLNMGNNPITTSNFFFGKAIELDAGIEEVGGTVIFRQRTAISGGGANYTTFGAVSNNVLNFSFWQDAPSGINRYKNFQFRTDNLTISTNRIYQMPDASGTLALTSNLSSYVPYTGATGSVNLGAFDISSRYIFSNGNGTASGLISMKIGNTITGVSGYGTIGAASGQQFVFNSFVSGSYSKTAYFNFSGLTDDVVRSYVFPDANGTIALTSDLGNYVTLATDQTISGTKRFSNPLTADKGVVLSTGSTSFTAGATTLNGNANGLTIALGVTIGGTTTSYAHQLLFPQITPRTYTFPAASGTVALTSDFSSYLPLSGGTLTGALGGTTATLSSNLTVNGEIISNNYLRLAAGFAIANNVGVNSRADHSNISVLLSPGQHSLMFWTNTDWSSKLVFTPSANRTFTFPNANGTVALTSDLGSYLPLSGGILTGKLAGVNLEFSNPSAPFVSGGVINSSSTQTIAVPNGSTWSNGSVFSASNNTQLLNFGGGQSIQNGSVVAGTVNVNRISFTAGSSTISMAQSTGIRAMAGMQMLQQTGGTINGTVSHGASMFVQGVYPSSSANVTFSNYYGLLMNPLDEWGGVTFTNRWGIYQSGASDKNYFNGNLLVKSTTDNGSALQVTGNSTFSGTGYFGSDLFTYNNGGIFFSGGGAYSSGIFQNPSGFLVLKSGNANQLTITTNSGGIAGIGVSPSSNWNTRSALQVGGFGTSLSGYNGGGGATELMHNGIANGFSYTYFITAGATKQYMDGNDIGWSNAPIGTAGAAITFTPRMKLTGTGNLLIGTETDNGAKLQVNGTANVTKANTFSGSLSVPNNTATLMQVCAADGGIGSMYLIIASIGGAGSDRIAMGILATISQGGGTARWAYQNDGGTVFLTDPGQNGYVYVRQTTGSTQTINYSVFRISQ